MSEIPLEYLERLVRAETEVQTLKSTVGELRDDVKYIRTVLDQSKGGMKMLLTLVGVASAVGGAVGWAVSHFRLFGGSP